MSTRHVRRNKYGNVMTTVHGIEFASKKEARRYQDLLLLEKAGEICNLFVQRPFPIVVNGVPICSYIADFTYSEIPSGRYVIEDVKSPASKTPVYRLKKKLMVAVHALEITEI